MEGGCRSSCKLCVAGESTYQSLQLLYEQYSCDELENSGEVC